MSSSRRLWQGRPDNLCGIYCALYVLRQSKALGRTAESREKNGFLRLLQSAATQQIGIDAQRIAGTGSGGGYFDREIARIFNGIEARFRRGVVARRIRDVAREYRGDLGQLTKFIDDGAMAMVPAANGRHWVLLTSSTGECFDPSLDGPRPSWKRSSNNGGVLFLKEHQVRVLNAQKN